MTQTSHEDAAVDAAEGSTPGLDRRTYLRLLGLATAPAAASAVSTSGRAATTDGFGAGAYGHGPYVAADDQ